MTDNDKAIQEAERNEAIEEYFWNRMWLKTQDNVKLFKAGFDHAYSLLSKLRAPVASTEVMDALNWVDDFIARCNRDDRGSCESVNVLRRALASAPVAGDAQKPLAVTDLQGDVHWKHGRKPGIALYAAPQASEAARVQQLEAARIAYAREFPPDENGDPDVGNIHANIRKLKSKVAALSAQPGAQKKENDS